MNLRALIPHALLLGIAAVRGRGARTRWRPSGTRLRPEFPTPATPKPAVSAKQTPRRRKHKRLPTPIRLLLLSVKSWKRDSVPRMGAALAYYSLFAMAPVLLVVIAVAGLVWGQDAVRGQIVGEIAHMVGEDGANVVQDMLRGVSRPREGRIATIVGGLTLVIAVSGAFLELQSVLNKIWRVKPVPGVAIKRLVLNRLRSFGMVLTLGLLILMSLAASAALSALSSWAGRRFEALSVVWPIAGEVLSFAVITLLFTMIYKMLPDIRLKWRNVWLGAAVTAAFFTIGKFLIGLYISKSNTAAAYGAAAAVAILLIWVYYTTQIVLLGAEFTRVFTRGHHIVPRREPYARSDRKPAP